MMIQAGHDSPVGPLMIAVERGRLCGLRFGAEALAAVTAHDADEASSAVLDQARRQLDAYFAGELRGFDLPLSLSGTAFQQRVWAELRRVPFGRTLSYRDLAGRLGSPGASRAVGSANAANPVAIVVPCHRVIAADGSLAGFAGGIKAKRRLLDHERAHAGLFAAAALGR